AGALRADYGDSTNCLPDAPPMGWTGSSMIYNRCHAVMAPPIKDMTSWRFQWTAPQAGHVTLFYGVVDGDCMMNSLGDDVKAGSISLNQGTASIAPPPPTNRNALAFLALLPGVAIVAASRRRRR